MLDLGSTETVNKILSVNNFYEGRNLDCKVNLKDQTQLRQYNIDMVRRKVILKITNPALIPVVTDEQLKLAVEKSFGPLELVYGIKDQSRPLGYYYLTMRNINDAQRITNAHVIQLKL